MLYRDIALPLDAIGGGTPGAGTTRGAGLRDHRAARRRGAGGGGGAGRRPRELPEIPAHHIGGGESEECRPMRPPPRRGGVGRRRMRRGGYREEAAHTLAPTATGRAEGRLSSWPAPSGPGPSSTWHG